MTRKLGLLLSAFIFLQGMYGQDGTYNQDFASGGVFELIFPNENVFHRTLFELEDRNLLLNYDDNHILKLSEDGVVDQSYGDNGILSVDDPVLIDFEILDEQDDQHLLVKVSETLNGSSEVAFARMSLDGVLDISFGDNGLLFPFHGLDDFNATEILEDNSFLVVGLTNIDGAGALTFKKYTPDGILDNSYGVEGIILVETTIEINGIGLIEIDANERLLLTGNAYVNGILVSILMRVHFNGVLDTSFGGNGVVAIPLEEGYGVNDTALLQNDNILVSSIDIYNGGESVRSKIFKLLSDGTLDSAFGTDGEIFINNLSGKLLVQPNQRFIFLAFDRDWEGGTNLYFKRYLQNGSLDSTFTFQSYWFTLSLFNVITLQNGGFAVGTSSIWYEDPGRAIVLSYNNSPLSVEENSFGTVSVYPNPSEGIFSIETNGLIQDLGFKIYDMSGKLLQHGTLDSSVVQIDLSEVSQGVYFLRVENQTLKLLKN